MATRRTMIGFAAASLAAAMGIAWLALRAWLPWITRAPDGRWRLGRLARFPEGSVTLLRRANAIVVHSETGLYALTAICTHERCTVRDTPARSELTCPCHGAAFDYRGRVLRGPAERDLAWLAIAEEDGELYLDSGRRVPPKT